MANLAIIIAKRKNAFCMSWTVTIETPYPAMSGRIDIKRCNIFRMLLIVAIGTTRLSQLAGNLHLVICRVL
jgi:hypothetical protein